MSSRQVQCLDGISRGLSNGSIAQELHLSEDTIKTHLRRAYRLTGTVDRGSFVAWGFRNGYLR